MTAVTSKDNEIIKLARKLSLSKKHRYENGMFLLEGLRICTDAVNENADISCILVSESAYEKNSEALAAIIEKSRRLCIITDELSEYISDTSSTQGIFGICKMLDKRKDFSKINNMGTYVVLVGIQDTGNLGTVIRTADAMGLTAVITVNCCDLYNPKTIRSTMGSLFRMTVIDGDIEQVFGTLRQADIKTYAAVIDDDAASVTECSFKKDRGKAIFIGNEGNGLPREVVDMCDCKVTIRMCGSVNSLNAASAASILMWELVR